MNNYHTFQPTSCRKLVCPSLSLNKLFIIIINIKTIIKSRINILKQTNCTTRLVLGAPPKCISSKIQNVMKISHMIQTNFWIQLLAIQINILCRQITTFTKVCIAIVFGLQTIKLKDFSKIYQLKGLKLNKKGHTNFYEYCDLTEKVYLIYLVEEKPVWHSMVPMMIVRMCILS